MLFWCLSHFLLALIGTWCVRRYALHRGLLDQPGERRSHAVATPRGGGIAIVVAIFVGCIMAALEWPSLYIYIVGFALGLVTVSLVGWWDDHAPLTALFRLCVHAIASSWLGWLMYLLTGSWSDAVLAALSSIVLINVWNFMDGIDGLATSHAMLAALGFALVLPGDLARAGYALLAACAGFIPFNFPKARIFLGDAGSGSIGYALAALMALCVANADISWWWGWLPLSIFLADAGFTLLARFISGQRWWLPHTQHVYQALARSFGGHVPVTMIYVCFSVIAVSLFLWVKFHPYWGEALAVGWFFTSLATWLFLRKKMRKFR